MLTTATDADLPAIAALVNAAYRAPSGRQGWTSEADLVGGQRTDADALRDDLGAKAGARLLILRDDADRALLGCVWIEPGDDADVWLIGMLTVRPDRQDRGAGRTLLAAAEALARDHRARRLQMTVISVRDTLIAWYRRRGYEPTGELRPYPYGDPPRPDLRFMVLEKAL